jgi:serine/threonine protein kinase
MKSRLVLLSHKRIPSKITVRLPYPHSQRPSPTYVPGYIYRHMAAGVPKQGLWAFYDIAHELGKGSFATVVKAINRTDHQWYAVKMIQNANKMKRRHVPTGNGANAQQDGTLELSREIKILEGLNHRNICKLKEVFFDKNPENESICWFTPLEFCFLVMSNYDFHTDLVLELVEGGDLLDYIVKNDGLGAIFSHRRLKLFIFKLPFWLQTKKERHTSLIKSAMLLQYCHLFSMYFKQLTAFSSIFTVKISHTEISSLRSICLFTFCKIHLPVC